MTGVAMPRAIRRPDWRLFIQDADATRDLMPLAHRVEWTDNEHGEADEVAVALEDDGRFIGGAWLPAKTDRVGLRLRFEGASSVDCGLYELDEQEFSFSPGRFTFRALSAPVSRSLRTRRTTQFSNTTLESIVQDIASRHALSVVGAFETIPILMRTQHDINDLRFLRELADEYGYRVKVDAGRIIFTSTAGLDALPAAITLDPSRLGPRSRIARQTVNTYASAAVEFTDPTSGETRTATASDDQPGGDVLRRHIEADAIADAERKAHAALRRANRAAAATGELVIEGDPRAVAGATVALGDGFGVLAGRYKIIRAAHRWSAGAPWTADLSVEGIPENA